MAKQYDTYHFSVLEIIQNIIISMVICLVISYLFYHTFFAAIFLSPYYIFYQKKQRQKKIRQQKIQLTEEFKDAMNALSSALEAGYSIENAIAGTVKDLSGIYNKDADIIVEFRLILTKISNHIPVTIAIEDFAERAQVEEIEYFYEVFTCARKTGGDLIKIMKKTAATISEKTETAKEIETIITEKKFEVSIMTVAPYGIICYLLLANPGFLSPLYFNPFGIIFMSILLLGCTMMSKLSETLMKIEI